MSASTPSTPRKFSFRSKSFWFICLFLIYSIFGWFIVPNIVESQLKENLKTLASWDAEVGSVVFNPYTLSLKLSDADIQDQSAQKVISFETLFINFSLIETLTGTISFDEISLARPFVHLDIDQHGMTNFQRDFTSDLSSDLSSDNSETDTEESSGEIIGLFFDLIAISSGKIHLTDNSQGESFELEIEPLSLSLEGFSTHNNDGGDYAISISLGNDQEINWHGQIGIAPFSSKGHLALKDIDSNSFWHYAKSASPYWLNQARISLSGDYETAINGDDIQLNIENTELAIKDAVIFENAAAAKNDEDTETIESTSLLSFEHLNVAPISFDLTELSLDLGSIELKNPNIFIERSADASLNILRPLSAQAETVTETEDTQELLENESLQETKTDTTSFQWNISGVNVRDGSVIWKDASLSLPAELGINSIDLSLGKMSNDLSQAFPYDLSFAMTNTQESKISEINEAVKQVIKGELSPLPFSVKGTADLSNIELASFQNYLSETANITVTNGRLNLQSDYGLAMTESNSESALEGKIVSSLSVNDLAITDNVLNKALSGFKGFYVGPVDVALSNNKPDITVDSVVLDQPYGDIFISENGQLNLSNLVKNKETNQENTRSESVSQVDADIEADSPVAMLLKLIAVKQGKFTYTDTSMKPTFTTALSELSGTIENISTDSEIKSNVDFKGKIDTHGALSINGTLNPLSKMPHTDIKVLASNIDLSMATPYSAKYAGYQIEKGKLDLDLSYLINDTKLKANNKILLNQFQFGKSVDSPDATNLPLALAIGMLKDRNGKIDINLPISGDLNDPSFRITSVILNTFTNLITKIVTSPFSILGGLIAGGDDISHIQFIANSNELSAEQASKIVSLAKALKERPNLTLEIRGLADANIDQKNNAPRPEHELIQLAKARAQAMNKAIIEEGNINAARVFVLEPELIALSVNIDSENKDPLAIPTSSSKFTLGVR